MRIMHSHRRFCTAGCRRLVVNTHAVCFITAGFFPHIRLALFFLHSGTGVLCSRRYVILRLKNRSDRLLAFLHIHKKTNTLYLSVFSRSQIKNPSHGPCPHAVLSLRSTERKLAGSLCLLDLCHNHLHTLLIHPHPGDFQQPVSHPQFFRPPGQPAWVHRSDDGTLSIAKGFQLHAQRTLPKPHSHDRPRIAFSAVKTKRRGGDRW